MVEFTLVLLPVVLLVMGLASFGVALNSWIDETHLASAAARFFAVNQNPGGESLSAWIKTHGDNENVRNATATICSPASAVGDYVEVRLKYNQKWLLASFGPSTTITSTAQMRIEVPPSTPYPTAC